MATRCLSTCFGLYVLLSLLTHLAELALSSLLAYALYTDASYRDVFFALTAGVLIIPLVTVQLASAVFLLRRRGDSMTGGEASGMALLHVLQLGFIWRHVAVLKERDPLAARKQLSELFVLRLTFTFASGFPMVLIQLYLVMTEARLPWPWVLYASLVASVLSSTWAVASFRRSHEDEDDGLAVGPDSLVLSWPGSLFRLLWRVGEIVARVISLTLFATLYGEWLFLVLGFHWVIVLLCLSLPQASSTDWCGTSLARRAAFCLLTSYSYIFCYINVCRVRTAVWYTLFYVIMFLENGTLSIVWLTESEKDSFTSKYLLVFISTLAFFVAMVCLAVYYKHFHVASSSHSCPHHPGKPHGLCAAKGNSGAGVCPHCHPGRGYGINNNNDDSISTGTSRHNLDHSADGGSSQHLHPHHHHHHHHHNPHHHRQHHNHRSPYPLGWMNQYHNALSSGQYYKHVMQDSLLDSASDLASMTTAGSGANRRLHHKLAAIDGGGGDCVVGVARAGHRGGGGGGVGGRSVGVRSCGCSCSSGSRLVEGGDAGSVVSCQTSRSAHSCPHRRCRSDLTDTTSVLTLASGASQNLGYEGSDESQSNTVPAWLPAGESLIAKHLMSPDSLPIGSAPGGDTDRQRRQDKAMENYRYLLKQEARRWGTTTPDGYSSDHTVLEWSRLPLTRLATNGSGSASVWGINEPDSDCNTCSCCHACCQLSPGDSEVSSIFRAAAHTCADGVEGGEGGCESCCCCGVGDDDRGGGGGVGGGGEEDVVYGIPGRGQDLHRHHHQQHQHQHHQHHQHQQRQHLRKGQRAKRTSSSDDSDGVCPGCQHRQLQHPVSEGKRYHSQPNVFTISHKEADSRGIGDQQQEEEGEEVGGYYGPKQSVSDSEGLSRKHGGVAGGGGGVSKKSKHSDRKKHRDLNGSEPTRERHHHHQHHNHNHHSHHHRHRDNHDVGNSASDKPREASPERDDTVKSKKDAAISSPRIHKPAADSPRATVAVDRKDSATPVPSKLQVKAIAEKSDEESIKKLKPGIPPSSSSSSASTEPIYENVSARSQKQQQQQQNQNPQTTSKNAKDGSRTKSKDVDKTDLDEKKELTICSTSHRNEEDESSQGKLNKDIDYKLKKMHQNEQLQNKANRDKIVSSSSGRRQREGHSAQTNFKKSSRAGHDNRQSSGRGHDLWYMCSESEDSALPPETFSSSVDDGFTGTDLDESDGSIELII